MERSSSSSDMVESVDWISKLPDDVLLMFLSRLSTEEAIRTSVVSRRWEHVWKHMTHLVLDMRKKKIMESNNELDFSNRVATLMTKVINNHRGHLESCVIDHYTKGMLNTWTQSLTSVKQTKHLTLRHHNDLRIKQNFMDFLTNSFSYPGLTSLSLSSYFLTTPRSFDRCQNLKTLKFTDMLSIDVGVFNKVIASCPSLEVLVLNINCLREGGPLRIENKRLKLLNMSFCFEVNGIVVSSPSLQFLAMDKIMSCQRDGFVLTSPRLQFNRNFWLTNTFHPHISYDISQEENCSVHEEFVVNTCGGLLRASLAASLSVSVDLVNPRQVERLRQVLLLWTRKIKELEILFKNNNAHREEEDEYSSQKKLWEDNNNEDPFPNAEFRVDTVWMHNFSGSYEEFALASRLIRQGTVVKQMMIKTTSFPAWNKLEIEMAVAKLQALQTKDQSKLTIECF
ncbi:unnamed protein product [Microthlaspi erraticum]|uniref:F-box domain-containing protein n=1 Tax=Microthlaspi erraticum TaxID=1685480 RepID=A0A6D2HUR3_9BRAS|nr:unnamed protein product [Microthlaspi erraticum]